MKMRKFFLFLSVVLVMVAFAATPAVSADKPIKWKVQAMWGAGELIYKTFVEFCKDVEVMTGGRLVMQPLPAGTIVPTFELLEAVQDNVVQAMNSGAAYYSGKDPGAAVISDLIYGYNEPWEKEAWFYFGGGKELLNEFYNKFGVTAIGMVQWGFESFPSKFPIKSMADYKGHKFRSPQGMTADALAKLGAGVVILPGGEVYSALDKGVIDGTDWGTPSMNIRLGFHQVCQYFVYPEYRSMGMSELSVNTEEWNKLPADIKKIVERAIKAWNQDTLQQVLLEDKEAVLKWEARGGKAVSWTKESVQEMRDFVRTNVWPDWAKKSPYAKKAVESQVNWLKKLGTIK